VRNEAAQAWDDYRRELARNKFGIFRSGGRSQMPSLKFLTNANFFDSANQTGLQF
jgi:hypothetical protein